MKERGKVNTFMKNFFRIFSECAIIVESYISGGFALRPTEDAMQENYQSVRRFLDTLTELIGAKYSAAAGLIRKALMQLAESKELKEAMKAVTRDFDYPAALSRYLKYPASKGARYGAAYLPTERKTVVAFVFCLLMDFDAGRIRLDDFLLDYFYVDGSYTAAFQKFADRMLRPFRDILADAFPTREETAAADNAGEEAFGSFFDMLNAERERIGAFSLREEELRAADVLFEGFHAAAGRRDSAALRALAEGYRYFLRYFGGEDASSEAFFKLIASL